MTRFHHCRILSGYRSFLFIYFSLFHQIISGRKWSHFKYCFSACNYLFFFRVALFTAIFHHITCKEKLISVIIFSKVYSWISSEKLNTAKIFWSPLILSNRYMHFCSWWQSTHEKPSWLKSLWEKHCSSDSIGSDLPWIYEMLHEQGISAESSPTHPFRTIPSAVPAHFPWNSALHRVRIHIHIESSCLWKFPVITTVHLLGDGCLSVDNLIMDSGRI